MIPQKKQVLYSSNGERLLNMEVTRVITFTTLPYVKLYVNHTLSTLNYFDYIAKSFSSDHVRNPKCNINVQVWKITSMKNKSCPYSLPAGSLQTQTQQEIHLRSAGYLVEDFLHLFLSFIVKANLKRLSTQYSKDIVWVGLGKKKTDLLTLPLCSSSCTQSSKTFIFFLQFCHHNFVITILCFICLIMSFHLRSTLVVLKRK